MKDDIQNRRGKNPPAALGSLLLITIDSYNLECYPNISDPLGYKLIIRVVDGLSGRDMLELCDSIIAIVLLWDNFLFTRL